MDVKNETKSSHFENGNMTDDVLKYDLSVENIPMEATEEEILEIFSLFGKVESVQWAFDKPNTKYSDLKSAIIKYADKDSLAKVFQAFPKKLKTMTISAYNSCEQSLASDDCQLNANDETVQGCKLHNITMLNDDCIECIIKMLEFKDQVRFAMTCQRVKNVFQLYCKVHYRNFTFDDLKPLSLCEMKAFFRIAGPHIETLCGAAPYSDRNSIINSIGKYCRNIERINIHSTLMKSRNFFKLFENMKNCTVLELRFCCLVDKDIKSLTHLSKLQFLSVADNRALTGKYMEGLTTISELVLYGCKHIVNAYFYQIITSLKGLKSLDMQLCQRLDGFCVSQIAKYCKNLESLKISCSMRKDYQNVFRFPSLKKLELSATHRIDLCEELFTHLVFFKANHLESLTIIAPIYVSTKQACKIGQLTFLKHLTFAGNTFVNDVCLQEFANLINLETIDLRKCNSISNDGLLCLMSSCAKLRSINIESCTEITDSFLLEVIEILESTRNQRGKAPCLFYVANSGITTEVRNQIDAAIVQGLLEVSYTPAAIRIYEYSELNDDFDDLIPSSSPTDSEVVESFAFRPNIFHDLHDLF